MKYRRFYDAFCEIGGSHGAGYVENQSEKPRGRAGAGTLQHVFACFFIGVAKLAPTLLPALGGHYGSWASLYCHKPGLRMHGLCFFRSITLHATYAQNVVRDTVARFCTPLWWLLQTGAKSSAWRTSQLFLEAFSGIFVYKCENKGVVECISPLGPATPLSRRPYRFIYFLMLSVRVIHVTPALLAIAPEVWLRCCNI